MTRAKPRAGIYLRISDDREGRGLGVKRQRDDTEALVESEGFELVGVFEDNDVSAFSGSRRPAWEDLLDRVRADEIDVIVAWATDRLTRNLRDLADLIDVLQDTSATVRTVTSGDIDVATPEGEFYATVVGGIARQESRRKSARAKRKAEELAQAGKVGGGGTRPFGFEDDRITVRDVEAALVREAIKRVASGDSLTSIAHDWSQRGVTTPTGRTWKPSVLRRMLLSPRIAGLREHRGEVSVASSCAASRVGARQGGLERSFPSGEPCTQVVSADRRACALRSLRVAFGGSAGQRWPTRLRVRVGEDEPEIQRLWPDQDPRLQLRGLRVPVRDRRAPRRRAH